MVKENLKVRVTPHLQVEGYDNVFAIGDCAATLKDPAKGNLGEEDGMAGLAANHGVYVVQFIVNGIRWKETKAYKSREYMYLLYFLL